LVAYRADKDDNGIDELYVNSISGGNEVLISSEMPVTALVGGEQIPVNNWQWASDSARIIFRSDPDSDGVFEIQTTLVDGSGLATLSQDLTTQCFSSDCWKLSGDGNFLTFLVQNGDVNATATQQLYSVALDGTNLVELNHTLSSNSRIHSWAFSEDNSLVGYISQDVGSPNQLYAVTPDGVTRTLISSSGIALGVTQFAFAPDSSAIAFSEDANLNSQISLFTNLIDANNRTELIEHIDVTNPKLFNWQWSANSQRVAFISDMRTQNVAELFSVEGDGEWYRKINPNLLPNGVVNNEWQWSTSGTYLSFFADIESITAYDELYIASADASTQNKVSLTLQSGVTIDPQSILWLSNDSRLLYQLQNSQGLNSTIYSVLPNGTANQKVSHDLTADMNIQLPLEESSDSSQILFRVDEGSGIVSLHNASTDGSSIFHLSNIDNVVWADWLTDSSRVIYVATRPGETSQKLFSVLPNGTSEVTLY
ncbi:MAG: hypothetical protein OQK04_01010, partial [Kangiellaceae bacterium]|nr:hypothetical protein [Kangiellaceae bacterium]